uniref:Uncharacterized protein n=1 Tax=Parascaris equorum TaxID=6256 RepID=A0A914R2V2_PAREQ
MESPSDDIVSLAEFVIPKLFVRLFLYFRGWVRWDFFFLYNESSKFLICELSLDI